MMTEKAASHTVEEQAMSLLTLLNAQSAVVVQRLQTLGVKPGQAIRVCNVAMMGSLATQMMKDLEADKISAEEINKGFTRKRMEVLINKEWAGGQNPPPPA